MDINVITRKYEFCYKKIDYHVAQSEAFARTHYTDNLFTGKLPCICGIIIILKSCKLLNEITIFKTTTISQRQSKQFSTQDKTVE